MRVFSCRPRLIFNAEHGPWVMGRLSVEGDLRYEMTTVNDSNPFTSFSETQARHHCSDGLYFEVNTTAWYNAGIVPGTLIIHGGLLAQLPIINADIVVESMDSVEITNGNSNCLHDSAAIDYR